MRGGGRLDNNGRQGFGVDRFAGRADGDAVELEHLDGAGGIGIAEADAAADQFAGAGGLRSKPQG